MDNASKALVMAGLVMIAIGLISLSIYVYTIFQRYTSTLENVFNESQVESFNRFYDSYPSDVMGVDAYNIYNKCMDDDIRVDVPSDILTAFNDNSFDETEYLESYTFSVTQRDRDGRVSMVSIRKK